MYLEIRAFEKIHKDLQQCLKLFFNNDPLSIGGMTLFDSAREIENLSLKSVELSKQLAHIAGEILRLIIPQVQQLGVLVRG